MRSITCFFLVVALAVGENVATDLFRMTNQPDSGLDHSGLLEAIQLRSECVQTIDEIYQNAGTYSSEKIKELIDAVMAKLETAIDTAAKYQSVERNSRGMMPPSSGTQAEAIDPVDNLSDPVGAKQAGLDQVIAPQPAQLGVVSIPDQVPRTPKQINWKDVTKIELTAPVPELNDSLWAAISVETRVNLAEKYVTSKYEALAEAFEAVQKVLRVAYPDQAVDQDKVVEFIKAHITSTDGFPESRRRLNDEATADAAVLQVDGVSAKSSDLYFKIHQFYNKMYAENVKAAKNLTPRTILSWLEAMTQTTLAWVEGASEVTLGQVWDFLVATRGNVMPNQETSTTADSYNEAFWFKEIVTSHLTRHQHMLGYSVFQLQIRAQLDSQSSPTESHGVWPWLTNQQIVEMVKQYDSETTNSSSTLSTVRGGMVENGHPDDYKLAGVSQNEDVSISEKMSQVKNASGSSEAYRAAMELLTAGMPVELMRDLSADALEQMKLTYNSMLSERALQVQQGRGQTRGLWPWISWPDLVEMANPTTSTSTRTQKKVIASGQSLQDERAVQLPINDGFSEKIRSWGIASIWPGKIRSSEAGNSASTPNANPFEAGLDEADLKHDDQSPENRFARKHAERLERQGLKKGALGLIDQTTVPIMALPAEIKAKMMEANELFAAQNEPAFSPRQPFPKSVDDVEGYKKNADSASLEYFGNLRGGIKPRPSRHADDSQLASTETSVEALDLNPVLAQLKVLDSMLS